MTANTTPKFYLKDLKKWVFANEDKDSFWVCRKKGNGYQYRFVLIENDRVVAGLEGDWYSWNPSPETIKIRAYIPIDTTPVPKDYQLMKVITRMETRYKKRMEMKYA